MARTAKEPHTAGDEDGGGGDPADSDGGRRGRDADDAPPITLRVGCGGRTRSSTGPAPAGAAGRLALPADPEGAWRLTARLAPHLKHYAAGATITGRLRAGLDAGLPVAEVIDGFPLREPDGGTGSRSGRRRGR